MRAISHAIFGGFLRLCGRLEDVFFKKRSGEKAIQIEIRSCLRSPNLPHRLEEDDDTDPRWSGETMPRTVSMLEFTPTISRSEAAAIPPDILI
jgi:hypothetical protein